MDRKIVQSKPFVPCSIKRWARLLQYRGTGVESQQCKPGAWFFQGWSVGAERLRFSPQPAASQMPTGSRCQQGGSALGNAVRLAWMCTFQALSVLLAAASVVPLMGTAANTTDTVYAGFTARTLCEGVSPCLPIYQGQHGRHATGSTPAWA